MSSNRYFPLFLAVLFGLTLSSSAFGYIDGGTGSLLLQATISGLLGAIFVFRSFFKSLPARFRRAPVKEEAVVERERRAA